MPLNTAPRPLVARPVGGSRPGGKDTTFRPMIDRSSTRPSIPGLEYMGPGGRNESFSGTGGGGGNRFGQRFNPAGSSTPVGTGGILGGGGPPSNFGRISPGNVFTPRGSTRPTPGGSGFIPSSQSNTGFNPYPGGVVSGGGSISGGGIVSGGGGGGFMGDGGMGGDVPAPYSENKNMPPPMNPRIPLNTTPTMPSPSAPMNPGPVTPPSWGRSGNTGYNPYPGEPQYIGDNMTPPPYVPPQNNAPRNMGQGLWNRFNQMY